MDLRRLRYFAQVAELGSMSRAAEQLRVAQPALSKSIQALEAELGVQLLTRSSQGVSVTDAGIRLQEHCQTILRQVDRARIEVGKTGDRPAGCVAIGMPHSVVQILGLPVMRLVSSRSPELRLELVQDHSHHLASRLRSGRLDLAVMVPPRDLEKLSVHVLAMEELFFAAPAEDASIGAAISFIEAARHRYILPSIGNGLRTSVEAQFRVRSLSLDVVHEVDAIALIPSCVGAGLGVSVLPGGSWRSETAAGCIAFRSFEDKFYRVLALCTSAQQPSSAASTVMDFVRQTIDELIEHGDWYGARLVI